MSHTTHWRRGQLLLSLVAAAATLPVSRRAEGQALDPKAAVVVRDAFLADMETVHGKVVALARAIPEDKYGWRPTPEVRTVSNLLLHIAMEWYYSFPAAVGGKVTGEWPDFLEARSKLFAITAKQDVLDQLDRGWAYGHAHVVAATGPQLLTARLDSVLRAVRVPVPADTPPMSFQMGLMWQAGDQHEHLGQLITYARSVGVVPPWSK